MTHTGTLDDLKAIIIACGFHITDITDTTETGSTVQIKTSEGAIVNWYQSTGTINMQGKDAPKQQLEAAWLAHTHQTNGKPPKAAPAAKTATPTNERIFIVHGHDETSIEQLELLLLRLKLESFVLANTGGTGLTLIEELEKNIVHGHRQTQFGIVLMTPDDFGYAKRDGKEKIEPRARQNVILEMGMLIAAVGRKNVAILKKGHVELPSDAHGMMYISYNDHVKETASRLVDRLTEAGFTLSPQNIAKAIT